MEVLLLLTVFLANGGNFEVVFISSSSLQSLSWKYILASSLNGASIGGYTQQNKVDRNEADGVNLLWGDIFAEIGQKVVSFLYHLCLLQYVFTMMIS